MFFFEDSALPSLRYYVTTNGIGDIYHKYGEMYAIQLKGTAILPFIFMLSFVNDKLLRRHKYVWRLVLLAGVVIAGNFAYLVAIGIFFCIRLLKNIRTKRMLFHRFCIFSLILLVSGPFVWKFVIDTMESKKEESNAIRIEQAKMLIKDASNNVGTLFWGTGLGHTITAKTKFRDYTDCKYFELQSLYFFNQLGIIPFLLFILLNLHLAFKYINNRDYLTLYALYILYAVTNPYILDTNQVVVIITLVNLGSIKIISKQNNIYIYEYNTKCRRNYSII